MSLSKITFTETIICYYLTVLKIQTRSFLLKVSIVGLKLFALAEGFKNLVLRLSLCEMLVNCLENTAIAALNDSLADRFPLLSRAVLSALHDFPLLYSLLLLSPLSS